MHNIKEIRVNFDEFKNKIKNRNIKINLDNILYSNPVVKDDKTNILLNII